MLEKAADTAPHAVDGAFFSLAKQDFELGEDLLDRIEVGAVGRQEQEAGASGPDYGPHGGLLVAGEVVHDDDITRAKRRAQFLLDPLGEGRPVDRLIEHERRIDPVAAQGGNEGHRLPVAIRHLGMEPLASGCPTPQRCHVGLGPGFIDEDEPRRIRQVLELLPLRAPSGDLGPELLGGKNAFF